MSFPTASSIAPSAIAAGSASAHVAPQLRSLLVPIESLELHPRNPRRGDVAAVAASLRRFGQQKPVVERLERRDRDSGSDIDGKPDVSVLVWATVLGAPRSG